MDADYSPWARHAALAVLRMLRPHALIGGRKLRVGRNFDGGYVMLDRFDQVEACYSLGINDDVSWDLDMALRGKPIFQYDPTIEALPLDHSLFHWTPSWIGSVADASTNRETLENAVASNGHASCGNLALKCDIEGAEWPLLQTTPNAVLKQFSQMVFEIHWLGMLAQAEHSDNIRLGIANLTQSHHVVHVHANNHSDWMIVGGIPIPETLELTLMRKNEGEFVPSQEHFPTALDMPCRKGRADLELGTFNYGPV